MAEIEKLEDGFTANKSTSDIKKAIVKGIPRQAVLKPGHAVYRLQNQAFALGDRVIMVQDSGSVPLAVKGVVIGLNSKSMDVVWDVPFMSGVTLGDRSVPFLSIFPAYRDNTFFVFGVAAARCTADQRWSLIPA